jgi:GNAT superfamily N-acetyltransferase
MAYVVKIITAAETIPVRHQVLRKGKPVESCVFDSDEDPNTFHIGAFQADKLIGVATYIKSINSHFSIQKQYQLRGMAVLDQYQGKHIGKLLLQFGEEKLHSLQVSFLWFNAREIAWAFYERNGYSKYGNTFMIPDIGKHIVMYKEL